MRTVAKSSKLSSVSYDIRGPVLDKARQMEEEGHKIIKLNIGNLAVFGLEPPDEIVQDMIRNLSGAAGYTDSKGLFAPRKSVVHYCQEKGIKGVTVDDIYLGNGASELIVMAINALCNEDDEVLLPAPDYPLYTAAVSLSGGRPVHYVCDEQSDWYPDIADIRAKITPRTRAIVVNDPLNPTGTVAGAADLAALARLCVAHDLFAICDEVWETVRFDDRPHASLLAQPGMAERAVKIGSAGKIFGVTGWKVGWLVAAPRVAAIIGRAHQFLTFTTAPMLQRAVADALDQPGIAAACTARWAQSRAVLNAALAQAGFAVLPNQATWFSCIDLGASGIAMDDTAFAERAVREAGVATIPLAPLWEGDGAPAGIVRLCHCKDPAMLARAVDNLARWRETLQE